jgi:hypothetical protein
MAASGAEAAQNKRRGDLFVDPKAELSARCHARDLVRQFATAIDTTFEDGTIPSEPKAARTVLAT